MIRTGDILVVDDDAAIRTVIGQSLRRAGHRVTLTGSIAEARRALAAQRPDALVSDVVLPDGSGFDMIDAVLAEHPDLPVILLSAQNTLTTAVRATEIGAYDYLPKPFDLDALSQAVANALRRPGDSLAEQPTDEDDRSLSLIGRSPAMQDVYRVIARVVANDLTVLISGESGTGKELVARAIHDLGPRRHSPFVAINMAAIPRELIEAELFGHERGAFTGASARAAGRFEQASGGTLFLDEIGDMPMEAQTRLLRVLQSGEFTTVGGARAIKADVRIVAATNRDLDRLVAGGQFREDLFYRLNVVPISLPALRERRADIPLLARHFLARGVERGLPTKALSDDAVEALGRHDWPGNVRELENLMRRLAVLERDDVITGDMVRAMVGAEAVPGLPADTGIGGAVSAWLARLEADDPQALADGTVYERLITEVERPLIEAMLARHAGNQLRTAKALGINRNTLRAKIVRAGVRLL